MRHRVKTNKLNRYAKHRNALLSNLARSVFEEESIITTTAKAKTVRPLVEKIITKAKEASSTDVPERKMALSREINKYFNDRKLVQKIVNEIGPRYATRNGGYTRILKIGFRRGDASELSILQLLPEEK
ncbi:MAG TPA: 50S ribosomal protein L17 [Tepiditoga sp.]|nr:50S ribosomal protein L17 [Thermotogota bacterium]HOO75301.1 50S ribosomal protein L17 [Tepiditoga sp.]